MAKVVIFSGAGISAESGISTFRDSDGLWNEYDIEDICMAGCLDINREMTLEFYNKRRVELKDKEPNYAHKVIAKLKLEYKNDIAVITQNVDDMFERAGCEDLIHLHGFMREIRCMKDTCFFIEDIGYKNQDDEKKCLICDRKLRPNIVFFGERAPMYQVLEKELSDCEMLVVIGTSGNVIDINYLFSENIKISILNNLESSDAISGELFSKVLYKKATEAIDEIATDIKAFLK